MSSSFTPSNVFDMSKEKDWPANLGMLDWDTTSIVFTKRSLIEFLKYTGTTVDTNFANIQKLPKYAKFGQIATSDSNADQVDTSVAIAPSDSIDDLKSSRRVRTVPGGPHTDIFAPDTEDDALSLASPRSKQFQVAPTTEAVVEPALEEEEIGLNFPSSVKPSRRVRTEPGGSSSLSNLWDSDVSQEVFKPSRRVRQGPGGQDHLTGIL